MNELMRRRRALMAARGGESFPLYLYNNGATSPIIGDWNTTGYRYGADSNFGQSKGSTELCVYTSNKYSVKGGRTFTGDNPIPARFVGKNLHVKGYWKLNGDVTGGRIYDAYAIISDSVQNASATQDVLTSGAFTNGISAVTRVTTDMSVGATKPFSFTLPITKAGYVSLVMYKGYNGLIYAYFQEVWIE